MLENLRSVYLQPLRDAELGLKPSRNSQLSCLVHLLSDDAGKAAIAAALKELDTELKKHKPIVDTQTAISPMPILKTSMTDRVKKATHYPNMGDATTLSANAASMKALEDKYAKVFHGVKTFEYDFALSSKNRTAMLAALKDIHPGIGADVEAEVTAAADDRAKAEAVFRGMFERPSNNVQKGRFAQALGCQDL